MGAKLDDSLTVSWLYHKLVFLQFWSLQKTVNQETGKEKEEKNKQTIFKGFCRSITSSNEFFSGI